MRESDRPHVAKVDGDWLVFHNRRERRRIGPLFADFASAALFALYLAQLRAERAGGANG